MATPKRKKSKSRVRTKRSHHFLKPINLTKCSNCQNYIPQHKVCPKCGFYKNKLIIARKEKSRKPKNNKEVKFPKNFNFSFIENSDKLLDYFYQAKKHFHNEQNVYFNLSEVKNVTPDAIALYIAFCTDKEFIKQQSFSGNLPDSISLQIIFIKAGFFNYVSSEVPKGINTEVIYTKSSKKVDVEIATQICQEMKLEKGNKFYKVLVELMANTHNHADKTSQGKYHWCFQAYTEEKIFKCSFIDIGIGIFESAPIEEYKKSSLFKSDTNSKIFEKILEGKLKSHQGNNKFTRTNQRNRGKGLPLIYRIIKEEKQFVKCVIISNNVIANIKGENNEDECFSELKSSFSGTFYYFEITNER